MASTRKQSDYRRVLIETHFWPDVDSCAATWLFLRFQKDIKEYDFRFVAVGNDQSTPRRGWEVVQLDTGRSIYDHHETQNNSVCSAKLVATELGLNSNETIQRMLTYVLAVDHGKMFDRDIGDFDLVNIIEGLNRQHPNDPRLVLEFALNALDGVYESVRQLIEAAHIADRCIAFDSIYGRAMAVETTNSKVRYLVHRMGFVIYVFVDPRGFRGYAATGTSNVDFTATWKLLLETEPDADWYLHHSRQLLLCGSNKAPDRRLSKLPLETLISLIQR